MEAYGLRLVVNSNFFKNELSWDGIIAIIAIVLGVVVFLLPVVWQWWRRGHPIKAAYSLDPYGFEPKRRKRKTSQRWQLAIGDNEVLVRVIPHVELTLRNVRVRLVEAHWFKGWPLKRWVAIDSRFAQFNAIHHEAMVDMFHKTSSSPLYYFESNVDTDGSVLGEFFDDHDGSKGKTIPAGDILWLGLFITGKREWSGRLEIEFSAAGQRRFERKAIRISRSPRTDMASFQIQEA